jgi:hypothetical protein
MSQAVRTLQETKTSLAPAAVLAAAKNFFSHRSAVYSAFLDMEGPTFVSLRGQGGEELVIAAIEQDGATRVTGSTYLFDQQVARFLSTLPTAGAAQDMVLELPEAAESLA